MIVMGQLEGENISRSHILVKFLLCLTGNNDFSVNGSYGLILVNEMRVGEIFIYHGICSFITFFSRLKND